MELDALKPSVAQLRKLLADPEASELPLHKRKEALELLEKAEKIITGKPMN